MDAATRVLAKAVEQHLLSNSIRNLTSLRDNMLLITTNTAFEGMPVRRLCDSWLPTIEEAITKGDKFYALMVHVSFHLVLDEVYAK